MLILGLGIKSLGTIIELFLPEILSFILDDIVPSRNKGSIIFWMAVMIICSLVALGMNIFANRNASKVARNITEHLRQDLFDHSLYLSCAKTDEFTIPSLEGRLTSDTYHVHRMISMLQRMGIRAPMITIGGLIMTFIMDAYLAMIFVTIIPLMAILIYFRATKGVPLFTAVQKAIDRLTSIVRENAQGIRVIKALSKTKDEGERFFHSNQKVRDKEIHANEIMAMINPMMNFFLYLGMLAVIAVGARRVSLGLSKVGTLLAFMSYFQMISRSLMAVSRMFIMYSRGMASTKRIMEVLNSETEKQWNIGNYPDGDDRYAIEFKDVTFSYVGKRDNLSHINMRIKKGESLGIIGITGSGKTSILSLLLRFYDVKEGAIYLNGKDIRNYDPRTLRKHFGIVMQNDFLFADTIEENISFGRKISEEEREKAIKVAQASDFINELQEGKKYTLTNKGANLSGGQRQRLLLARAFASPSDFLLLDDASSALDYQTDAKLRKALKDNYGKKTTVIVAQRVSSIQTCDQIVVLEKGKIQGIGKHKELLETNAIYQTIASSQMGGALFE
ncbi:MAG: ABC transporter ATP-binding protein [Solobacterium sp.]|nr:ABC transporter ATP-binding protein [Solobacterium sp.]